MNGIDNIIKRIAGDAEATAREIITAAESDARAMRDEYEKKAEGIREKILARAEKDAAAAAFRHESSAALEARKLSLAKKQELISSAFDAAVEKLSTLSDAERAGVLSRLALRAADGQAGEIVLAKEDKEIGGRVLEGCSENKGITLSGLTHSLGGGIIFKSGATEVNCTFRRLASELRDELSREVADILFG